MFRRHKRRHTNIVFVIFRLLLSLVIFAVLLYGVFSAYKHFSGVDPLKLNPKAVTNTLVGLLSQPQILSYLPKEVREKVLGLSKSSSVPEKKSNPEMIFRFALLADSHSDNVFLKRALDQIKDKFSDIRFIVGLGDYTDVGTLDELKKAKTELDSSGFRYFVAVGDHDLWDSRNNSLNPTQNFEAVFGPPYQSFIHEGFLFIILQNADNYVGLGEAQKQWLSNQLEANGDVLGTFVFLHEPLFHPSSDHFMGRVEEKLKVEAQELIKQLAQRGVKKLFAGDTHFFSGYDEPETNLSMVTAGAISSERNLQSPRFAIVSVFEDGSTEVEDVEVR